MGQGDCLEYLKKINRWASTKEIGENLHQSSGVSVPLNKLYAQGEILPD